MARLVYDGPGDGVLLNGGSWKRFCGGIPIRDEHEEEGFGDGRGGNNESV